jgi:hypothetical protein
MMFALAVLSLLAGADAAPIEASPRVPQDAVYNAATNETCFNITVLNQMEHECEDGPLFNATTVSHPSFPPSTRLLLSS